MIEERRKRHAQNVVVCAPTGVAALLCGGSTLHAVAGVGLGQRVQDFNNLHEKRRTTKWRKMKVLIIDEISMVEPSFLDWLDVKVREIRCEPSRVFGGIQIIFCGDFCQLPGITKGLAMDEPEDIPKGKNFDECNIPVGRIESLKGLTFSSAMWREADFKYFELKAVHRQSDLPFIEFLRKIRLGRVDGEVEKMAEALSLPLASRKNCSGEDEIEPTKLYSKNDDVEKLNETKLRELGGPMFTFRNTDTVEVRFPPCRRQSR